MHIRRPLWRRRRPVLLVAILISSTSACDGILSNDQATYAREARVIVANETPLPLKLVTSTQFVTRNDPLTGAQELVLLRADTTAITATTFDRTFNIFGADRFFTRLINPDSARTATVQLRIQLDGREVYSQRATLRDAFLQYANFYQR